MPLSRLQAHTNAICSRTLRYHTCTHLPLRTRTAAAVKQTRLFLRTSVLHAVAPRAALLEHAAHEMHLAE
jgi:hypothetical protein